jgi:Protein of unknown function (DUF3606)
VVDESLEHHQKKLKAAVKAVGTKVEDVRKHLEM